MCEALWLFRLIAEKMYFELGELNICQSSPRESAQKEKDSWPLQASFPSVVVTVGRCRCYFVQFFIPLAVVGVFSCCSCIVYLHGHMA